MAEILVKNWKMPENCYECPMMKNHLFHDGQKWQTGCFIERASNITFVEKRPSWCPLVELPQNRYPNPHGEWHTGTPTYVEDDIYWKWNYALVLNTEYDCIGNYLAGMLFMPNFEKNVFSAPLGNGKDLEVPFDDVIAWQKIEPYVEEK